MGKFVANFFDGVENRLTSRHVVAFRVDRKTRQPFVSFSGQRIKPRKFFNLIAEKLDPHRKSLGLRWKDVQHVATNPKRPATKFDLVPCVLQFREPTQDIALLRQCTFTKMQDHPVISGRIPKSIYRGDRCYDDDIFALKNRLGSGKSHLINMLIN